MIPGRAGRRRRQPWSASGLQGPPIAAVDAWPSARPSSVVATDSARTVPHDGSLRIQRAACAPAVNVSANGLRVDINYSIICNCDCQCRGAAVPATGTGVAGLIICSCGSGGGGARAAFVRAAHRRNGSSSSSCAMASPPSQPFGEAFGARQLRSQADDSGELNVMRFVLAPS